MDLNEKIEILSAAAKYDVSCSSSGSKPRKSTADSTGSIHVPGICHSFSSDGRCVSLLKVLLSNRCIYDCAYCLNRRSNDVRRASFTDDEIINLTIDFYIRNYIEGLFLSSAIEKNPDYTMERLAVILKRLREEKGFNGYIHVKAIPGASQELIDRAGFYADRMSVNIELPTNQSLALLAPQKKKESILTPMKKISLAIAENVQDRKKYKKSPLYVPAGQSTQLIVGATSEDDRRIITLTEGLYQKMNLKRVYYSAYIPVNTSPNLPPSDTSVPLLREHRLYQADWLLRFYNFKADELLDEKDALLPSDIDPKTYWALRNYGLFPFEVNTASYEMLLRIPGIGVRGAKRIITARRASRLNVDDLKKIGIVMKRAKFFITAMGKMPDGGNIAYEKIRPALILPKAPSSPRYTQLSLFEAHDFMQTVTGEI